MESLEENPWSDEDRVSHKPPPRCVHHSREALKSLRHLAGSSSQAPNSLLRESFVAQAETLKLVDPKRNLAKFVHSRKESLSNPVLRPTASEKISTASSRQPSNAHHDVKATNKENQANTPRASEETRQERSFSYASVTMLQTTQVREKVSKTTSNSSRSPATLETTAPTNKVFPSQARAHDPSPLEEQFFRWRRDVPRDNAMAYKPLSRYLLGQFFQQGLALVRSEHDTMQRVITLLAQEGGLRRIDEVVSAIPSVSISFQKKFFTEVVLPFLQTVSHERVLASAVLEAPLTKIMQFVYGPNGHRAIEFFTIIFALPKPSALDPPGLDLGDAAAAVLYEPSILVLSKIIDLNGGALINEEIHQLVESICKKINETGDDLTLLTVRKYLQRIRRRLDRVTSNDSDKRHHKISPSPAPKFHIAEERPGKLSDQGPRHDNDSENICDIKIMPTSQEIQSEREEYLPTRDPSTWHLRGLPGLLDRHFRLLREDTVGQLRDAVSAEFKRMQNPEAAQPRASKQMLRTITYHNVRYMQLLCDRRGGLRFVIQFDQPAPIKLLSSNAKRKDWWQAARRLQRDVLVCLIDSDGSAIFCYVSGLYRTQPQRGGLIHSRAFEENIGELSRDQDFGYVTLSPVQQDAESLKEILARFRGSPIYKMESLVEFPGVLLPSFQSTLVALQDMAKTLELPFADVLAPESVEASGNQWIDPPSYSLKKKFKFNLRSITEGERLMLPTDGSPFDFEKLRDHSSLDDAQATALVDALTRSLALIQGPPGTGKSYTGVAIIKVLLDNRAKAKLGPVICVCYTNHALDQLLNQLIESGVENVVRIGSQSKSSVLDSVNLRAIAEKMSRTRTENKQKFTTTSALLSDISELNQCIEDLSKVQHWATIKDFLSSTYPKHHDDLFGENDNEWQTVRSHPNQIISTWLDGGIPNQTGIFTSTFRSLEDLRAVKLHLMSKPERQSLLSAWISEIREDVEARIQDAYATYLEDKEEHDKIMTDINLRCLQNAHIIGVTSTGLAKNLDLLRRLSSKVIICEEAGEVLEAHTLTTLLPSIEHAILIGDHQQLRPKIDNWELNSENPRGEQYSLDMSLFERLVNPPMPSIQLPFSSLEVQRRMHPSISRLIRQNLYPHLKDSGAVQNYPAVAGMKKRLFWFHHQQLEAPQDPTRLGSASHYNQFELDFTAALVSHLVRQGIYEEGDIAILTPYLGQLMRLRKKLSTSHEIVIGERDAEELEQAGLDEMDERIPQEKPIQKTTLLKALRVSTVDNFQGEEAKVVVISLVRSNKQQQCGFLRTPNRINVLLSRAKHGMYIIGNADTSYKVQMWANVVKMLEQTGNFGEHLELFCPRHPRSVIRVAKAEDFHSKAPEGGCDQPCGKRLKCPTVCGEQCPNGRYCQTCAPDEVRELVVDPWAFQKYKDVDLDRNPVVVPGCGHVQTVESLDVFMEMTSYYNLENDGKVVQLKSSSQPFSSGEMKVCPICSASLRDSARYGRIVRRAILDTSTRKLLLWAYKTYHPLAQQMDAVEQDLVTSRELFVPDSTPPHLRLQEVRIEGSRSKYLETIRTFSIYRNRHASILALRNGINLFSHKIREEEQPFIRLFELVRERNSSDDTAKAEVRDTSIVQTRGHLLAFSLLIRCDLAILTDFLALKRREVPQQKIHVDLSMDRKECQEFISLAGAREQPLHVVEGHVYMAWYAALEVAFTADSQKGSDLLDQADYHLSYAQATTEVYPDQTEGMQRVIEGVKKLLDDRKKLEYYVCATERQILLASLATEFSTTGKWYTCTRGHPFTIEGDASKLRESGCPQCSGKVIMQGRMHDDNVSQTADFAAGGVLR
ncbi:MAG: hypothetical protein M1822_008803 [Bathelium mastoideum]|nr:MAG: hypothetical protein M1822_008803 [Bathelium mastoideum]